MNTYSTSEIARLTGIHPNTVRLYEALQLIPDAKRKENGYRVFNQFHLEQIRLARLALKVEVLQNGLRKQAIEIIKTSARGELEKAEELTKSYLNQIKREQSNAEETIQIVKDILSSEDMGPRQGSERGPGMRSVKGIDQGSGKGSEKGLGKRPEKGQDERSVMGLEQGTANGAEVDSETEVLYTRKEAAELLNITMDSLRNWEMNGLLTVRRKTNGYRVYGSNEIKRLKIIRALRCANYSLTAILRMLSALSSNPMADVYKEINTPREDEDIISVCDELLTSLKLAEENARLIIRQLELLKACYEEAY